MFPYHQHSKEILNRCPDTPSTQWGKKYHGNDTGAVMILTFYHATHNLKNIRNATCIKNVVKKAENEHTKTSIVQILRKNTIDLLKISLCVHVNRTYSLIQFFFQKRRHGRPLILRFVR